VWCICVCVWCVCMWCRCMCVYVCVYVCGVCVMCVCMCVCECVVCGMCVMCVYVCSVCGMCVYIVVCVCCICVCVVCVCVCVSQRIILGEILRNSISLLVWSLPIRLDWLLVNLRDLPVSSCPVARIISTYLAFSCRFWGIKLRSPGS